MPAPALPSIQSLRAIAALMVVGFHTSQWTEDDFRIGMAGVDLFFVISGAVMWISAMDRDAAPLTFLARRAVRIAPAYWAATLVCVAIALGLPGLMIHLKPEPLHVVLSLGFVPHLDPEGEPFPLLSQGWTLVYEAGFYLAVALSLLAPKAWRLGVVFALLLPVSIGGFFHHPAYRLGATPLVLEFAVGAWLGSLYTRRLLSSAPMGWACLILGAGALTALHLFEYHHPLWRPFLWGPPAMLIVFGALALEQAGRAPRLRPLELLGDTSYSLYLWHTLAIALLTLALAPGSPAFIPAALAVSLVAALASRALIEGPSLALSRRLTRPPEAGLAGGEDGRPMPARTR